MTSATPMTTDRDHQQPISTNINNTSHPHGITASPTAVEMSPGSSPGTSPSPQPPSSIRPQTGQKKSSHAGRKRQPVSAAVARSKLLWSTAGVKGAIVVLVLGIAVTMLTLAYIGCHYRHQRKLSRRRRHLSAGSNDADYLVNGMYL